jgi:predicted aconitase/predicted aconitase with swiveling domain
MVAQQIEGKSLVPGRAKGDVLFSDVSLSFWGGVDTATGQVIDRRHPLWGKTVSGKVLAIPGSRGSCSGSGTILELILNDRAPAALVLEHEEEILPLGVIIAEEMFNRSLPVIRVCPQSFARLRSIRQLQVSGATLFEADGFARDDATNSAVNCGDASEDPRLMLEDVDRTILAGGKGSSAQLAMRIIVRMAKLLNASRLIDISQAHIDGCVYSGPGSLRFAEHLCGLGARVSVPTTLNAVSVDRRQWRKLGVDPVFGEQATRLADAYVRMGAHPTYTCAPYLLESAPSFGDNIGWAESNAVVYANSILGARTMKYPDFLDICIALTGRAPMAGCHTDAGRAATIRVEVAPLGPADDALFPLLGYHIGHLVSSEVPLIVGLEGYAPTRDDLKAFGAAFATTSSAPMFHLRGITPEAESECCEASLARRILVSRADLVRCWDTLNSADTTDVDLVCIGSPHASFSELARLADLCRGRVKNPSVLVIVTCGRAIHDQARDAGLAKELEAFGVRFLTDTCWCMLQEPVIPPGTRTLMTNSAKYAHYAPGLVGRLTRFGSLADCVDAACYGRARYAAPAWLVDASSH